VGGRMESLPSLEGKKGRCWARLLVVHEMAKEGGVRSSGWRRLGANKPDSKHGAGSNYAFGRGVVKQSGLEHY
jgi:hypothetical protein